MSNPNRQYNKMDKRLDMSDNIYLDTLITNSYNDKSIQARYSSTRTSPIVEKPTDYYMSIVRFDIPNQSIPLFIFKDDFFKVTMVNNVGTTAISTRSVSFISTSTDPNNRGVYAVQYFLNMINATIAQCAVDVGIVDAPVVFLQQPTQYQGIRFSNNIRWLGAGTSPDWQLWFNQPLFYFFRTMATYFVPQDLGELTHRIIVQDNNNGNFTEYPSGSGTNVYEMTQETNLLVNYITISKIIVTTSSMPLKSENISIGRSTIPSVTALGDSNSLPIITDFVPGQFGEYSENFTSYIYNPSFYRLIDINFNTPLYRFDYQVSYVDVYGNIEPLYIEPGSSMSMKFGFFKKSLYNNEYD